MGIDASWQDENGHKMQFAEDKLNAFSKFILRGNFSKSSLLQYIDPFGDTVFNQLQIPNLIEELEGVASLQGESKDLENILKLVNASKGKVHTYIKFIGD